VNISQERRDPRFSTLSGEFNPDKFEHSYSFVADIQQDEVASLRKSLSLARKLSQSSPAHLREERAAEVTRLERALKRTESTVERAKREKRNREVLSNVKKEERSKREKGKGGWFMKTGKQNMLLQTYHFAQCCMVMICSRKTRTIG
jgi:ribosomal RNA-processing protein 36